MLRLTVRPDGSIQAIYDDRLVPVVATLGPTTVARASHVEPCEGGWSADMSPVGGPLLGPFALRQDALDAEVDWLKTNLFL